MATAAVGPYSLDPVFPDEDIGAIHTLTGSGSIAGAEFLIEIVDAEETVVLYDGTATYVNITDPDARKVKWTTNGKTLVPGTYYWKLRRTDNRTVCAFGDFRVRHPAER